ncbi:alpha-galactosidase [Actinoplanes lutulentus]|uniref:alpha-galactosidase n=1 Tax=Actinoplanes lutulentus TaxID=1287878 RepID=A0A327Z3K0_9ACTN|nr:alpha-galactosidase [Actinoplanes lutulentus]MBB2948883.1 alpha-galactosidase [Actinoplanes lutulentus]RAK29793.1 alpha-galactosidase [Actinoplanes lutulentus]
MDELLHWRAGGVSLVLDHTGPRLPRILHWGADIGDLDPAPLKLASIPQPVSNTIDEAVPVSLLPEQSAGWTGTPGLTGHRDGRAFSTFFETTQVSQEPRRLAVHARDADAGLSLLIEIEMTEDGLLRQRATVTNDDPGSVFQVDSLTPTFPVPTEAGEILDFTGRHKRERIPQRQPFTVGTRLRENRRGRTGADSSYILAAGETGLGFRSGEVWGVHVAWSGNHRTLAERTSTGVSLLGGGELLLSGEVRLAPGASYRSPWLYGSYGSGLDALSHRFHRYLRSRPQHPRTPRPVILNTWEAVYFDHDLTKLTALADVAAQVGVERFVLDDGWFRHRRNDRAGLGDWYVDETVWPKGLHPLVDHVRALGMGFGLWVEPEMINVDSDLARAHPEWILATGGRLPPEARHQQVLDLGHEQAYAYLLERLDALLTEYDIEYLKWDHNRDLIDAGHSPGGEAGVHTQTLQVYRLLDELRARHPGVEIESCSSGGSRVDLGILERTDRIWASDCNDALERQAIQRWTGLLVPPEMVGAHVGPTVSHTTGRVHTLDFRAGTALFGHFGIEWDLTKAGPDDRERLAEWIRLYKRLRGLLHHGTVVRSDHPDPSLWVHGVVADDLSEAVFTLATTATPVWSPPGRVRLPGLDPHAVYRLAPLAPADEIRAPGGNRLPWWDHGVELSGRTLAVAGVQAPVLFPERLVLIQAIRTNSATAGQRR